MASQKTSLAIITARGGSKGVPRKNLRMVGGKPLLAWAIEAAKKSERITDVVVSTEDAEISQVAQRFGASVVERPERLAQDNSLPIEAIRHTLQVLKKEGREYDYFTLLEPTSPMRTPEIIDECLQIIDAKQADSLATFNESTPPTRLWKFVDDVAVPFLEGANPWLPRQQQAQAFELNGLVYAVRISALENHPSSDSLLIGKTIGHIVKGHFIDIDTEADLNLADKILRNTNENSC